MLSRTSSRSEIVGLLDIGSSKVCCLIVERTWPSGYSAAPAMRVLGVGHQRSRGVKAGMVIDLEQAEAAVRAAVGQAERMADVTLEDVIASVSCGRPKSVRFTAHVDLESGHVRSEDKNKLVQGAYEFAGCDDRAVIHLNRVAYRLDGETDVRDPLNMVGRRLSANFHAVTVDPGPLENLRALIDRCFLEVRQWVPASLASALSATTLEERRLGITCVDYGAGVIDIAIFEDGQFIHADSISVGGSHLTYDIAKQLATPPAEAERIKTLCGTLIGARSDEHEVVPYRLAGDFDDESHQTTKAQLRRILYPRVETQLDLLRQRLTGCEIAGASTSRVLLCGGASQLVGFADAAAQRLGRPARMVSEVVANGLPPSMSGPASSTVVGLGLIAPLASARSREAIAPIGASSRGGCVMDWLRGSF